MLYLVHLQFFWSSYFYSLFYDRLPSTLTIKKTLPLVLFNQLTTCLIIYNLESSFSLTTTSAVPLPKMALSPGSGYIP